ncbi:hypothetical protein PoB_006872100 [Plakobranchus ocellatus]|uniref:Uncharacterized protein n=1 Tax=Plakobranchus ocellatus TaxID=259542 RepID=A0AAV4DDN3_9GAST|nr:hypothetical protein PoB_006872100 [Plakobranchus ocellatus]
MNSDLLWNPQSGVESSNESHPKASSVCLGFVPFRTCGACVFTLFMEAQGDFVEAKWALAATSNSKTRERNLETQSCDSTGVVPL